MQSVNDHEVANQRLAMLVIHSRISQRLSLHGVWTDVSMIVTRGSEHDLMENRDHPSRLMSSHA